MKYFLSALITIFLVVTITGCRNTRSSRFNKVTGNHSEPGLPPARSGNSKVTPRIIDTKNTDPDEVVRFAETLIGTKYKYGSANKEQGLDCSGLITYVFSKFKIQVPRSSVEFTNAGIPTKLETAKTGDLILFTGTDTTGWVVGHMGIITSNEKGEVKFIHSSSGKGTGVIISSLSKYYRTRFVKAIRIFK